MNANDKIKVCAQCPYHKKMKWLGKRVITCGNFLDIGKPVQHEGREIKLCGCIMNVKTLLNKPCPAGKF